MKKTVTPFMKLQSLLVHKIMLFFLFLIIANILKAQEIIGKPVHLGPGITKTVDEIIEFGKKNAANDFNIPPGYRAELELPPKLTGKSDPAWNISRYPIENNAPQIITSGLPAPNIWSNLMATDFSTHLGGWPPDNNGDVGTTQIFISQNFRFRVYTKPSVTAAAVTTPNGTSTTLLAAPVMDISPNNFFRIAFAAVNTTDPHVRFDRLSGRWFIVAQSTNEATNNYLLFAISSGATITSVSPFSFTFFRVQLSSFPAGNPDIGKFLDYPTLGVDKNSLYLGANLFTSNVGSFSHSSVYVVNKADMIANILTITPFSAIGTGAAGKDIITPQGVHNDDPAANQGYFAGESISVYNRLVMRRVTYSGSTPILSADINVAIPANQDAVGQPAQGSSGNLDAVGGRYYAGMVMKDKIANSATLWMAETIGVNAAGVSLNATNNRNASRWIEIQNLSTTPVLKQAGTLFNTAAANQRGFWVPSIAMSGQGHAVLVSSTSAANTRIDINIAGRYRTTTLGSLVDTVQATVSASAYNPISGGFVNRWGDYSQVTVDPQDNMTMWAFHQYCNTTNSYGVRAIQIKAPPPATPSLATVPGCGATVAVTINGTSVNNSEFFDPGADAGGPGFNRLTITCSGGITVTGTTFVNPTQLTCFLDTRGKASGTYTITVTNPDGQFASVNFSLVSGCPLPVTLLSFTGKLVNNESHLNWKTAAEYNLKTYGIEKSLDGINFKLLKEVPAKGLGNAEAIYQSIDKYPYPGFSYYRLKMVDRDAYYTYSNIVLIQTQKKDIAVTRMYPNPLHDNFNLEIFAEKNCSIQIDVFDVTGKKMVNRLVNLQAGLNDYQLNLKSLAAGNYFMQVKDISGQIIEKTKLVKE